MSIDKFGYSGKRVLVVGGASGMGAAAASLAQQMGADVMVMDFAPIDLPGCDPVYLNLNDIDSIDAALATTDGSFNVVLMCAGVADGTPGLPTINFIGHRYLIESLVSEGRLPRGSSIGMISSTAGLGWEGELGLIHQFLDTPDFDSAEAWIEAHDNTDTYKFSKRAMNAYVARQTFAFMQRGIRINAVLPGPTDTPLARANADVWLRFGSKYRDDVSMPPATPEDQAYPLLYLCSDAASYISGATLVVDAGFISSGLTDSYPDATRAAVSMLGRVGELSHPV
jgi:NAD(P)-dependent dehydrogenase (short-subunit alcohol dehydrogenase family)